MKFMKQAEISYEMTTRVRSSISVIKNDKFHRLFSSGSVTCTDGTRNQLMQLCTAGTFLLDPVNKFVSVRSCKFTISMVANEKLN